MLELFTKSRIRKKIILLLLYNPNKELYLSEIAKKVGTSPGTAQRELNRLLRIDFVRFKKKGNLSIYTLNKRYSLLKEVESIIKKTFGAEVELKKELSSIPQIAFAFLFGSYVKGGFKSDSDIDLFVVGDVDENKVFNAVQGVEMIIGREINYHIASKNEFVKKLRANYFHREITEKVILLIGNEHEFKRLIK